MTAKRIDIHDYKKKLEAALRKLKKCDISDKNKKIINNYVDYLFNDNLSRPRILKYVTTLRLIVEKLEKDLDKVTKEDLKKFSIEIHNKDDYSEWTKKDYIVTIKKFYKWFEGNDEEYPEKVKWMRTTVKKKDRPRINKSELVIESESMQLIKAADNMRDKALISLSWETGARIGELGSMKIKSVKFEDTGATVDLKGKTGSRSCLVIQSAPYLSRWIDMHPDNENREAPLWINLGQHKKHRHQALDYASLYKTFERLFVKAGITKLEKINKKKVFKGKKFNPHLMRHSRATFLAADGWTSYQLCKYMGWELDSDMPSVYLSLTDSDVNNKVMETYGYKNEKEIEDKQLKICPRCKSENPYNEERCYNCHQILDLKLAMQQEEKNKMKDEFVFKIIKGLVEKGKIGTAVDIIHEEKLEKELKELVKSSL